MSFYLIIPWGNYCFSMVNLPYFCNMSYPSFLGMSHHKTMVGKCGGPSIQGDADAAALPCGSCSWHKPPEARETSWGLFLSWLLLISALSCTKPWEPRQHECTPRDLLLSWSTPEAQHKFHPFLLQVGPQSNLQILVSVRSKAIILK